MRLPSSLRLTVALCGTLLLCLLSVAVADAAPSRGRVVSHRKACGARVGACRVKVRAPKATRPARYFVRVQRLVHRHPGSWLERSRPDPLRESDEAALQDRTAVAGGEDDLLLGSLEPVGALANPRSLIIIGAIVAPHSPRGPPSKPGDV